MLDDGGLGAAIAPPSQAPRAARAAIAASGVIATPSRSLQHRGRSESEQSESDGLTDPMRDIYVPTALVAVGFLAFVIWVFTQPRHGPMALMAVSLFVGLATAIKTAIIIGLALVYAPSVGISFGLLRTAILKFAAVIVFSDAVLLWVEEILRHNGGISQNGKTVDDIFWVILGVTAAAITATSYYLFSMDLEEIATFAIPMAIVSRVIGFVLNLVVIALLAAVLSTGAKPAPGPIATAPPNATPAPQGVVKAMKAAVATPPPEDTAAGDAAAPKVDMTPVAIVPTAEDKTLAQMVSIDPGRGPIFWKGLIWRQKKGATETRTRALIDRMQAAGAAQTYIMTKPAPRGSAGEPFLPAELIVELPAQKGPRQACFDAALEYVKDNNMEPLPTTEPATEQYLVVKLRT
jgi:hypothetical protein